MRIFTTPFFSARHAITLTTAFVGCLLAQTADVLSSCLHFPDGVIESNEFARHADGSFDVIHGIVGKGIYMGGFSALTVLLFLIIRPASARWAAVLAVIPLIYFAFLALNAAEGNVMMASGWFQP